jgi:hypothetical protein
MEKIQKPIVVTVHNADGTDYAGYSHDIGPNDKTYENNRHP